MAHSMGGDITRTLPQVTGYVDKLTYGIGYVHKLVEINTPNEGSPLASALHSSSQNNSCVRTLLALAGRYSFLTAQIGASVTFNGGTGDLRAATATTQASAAITSIHTGSSIIPMAMIGSNMTASQLAGVGTTLSGRYIKLFCSSTPLAQQLTAGAWPTLMTVPNDPYNGESDGIVPYYSQFDFNTAYPNSNPANTFSAVHSTGTESLGFKPPSILDAASGVPIYIIVLLNTPVSNSNLYELVP